MYCRLYQSCSYRHVYSRHVISPQLTVRCRRMKTAPCACAMIGGSATTDHQFSYFNRYSYQWSTEKWEELPPCPYYDSGLVIINGQLTAVGGYDGPERRTNKLFTLRQSQWIEEYPPMNTARSSSTVVSSSDGEYIIVIGGDGELRTTTVELFQVSSRRWHQLKDLPQRLSRPSATICGNQLHVIGGDRNGYSCSLQALLSSDRPITSQSIPHLISWTSLPPLPVEVSTAATLSGQLVIIGGWRNRSPVKTIHQLFDGQWVEIGSMSCDKRFCSVVSPSPDKMMIVGGEGGYNDVEECIVV